MKSADLEKVVTNILIGIDDTGTPEERAEKKLKREAAVKKAKMVGGFGLLALLLLVMAGVELGKNATGGK